MRLDVNGILITRLLKTLMQFIVKKFLSLCIYINVCIENEMQNYYLIFIFKKFSLGHQRCDL